MKKLLIAIVIMLSFSSVAYAVGVNGVFDGFDIVKVKFNGNELKPDKVPGIIYKGNTLVPLGLLRQAGFNVTWDNKTLTADIQSSQSTKSDTTDILDKVISMGGSGYSITKLNGVSTASTYYTQRTEFNSDWVTMFGIINQLAKLGTNYVEIGYLDKQGNEINKTKIDSQTLLDYATGKVTSDYVVSQYQVTGQQPTFRTALTTKEIAKPADRVGFVNIYDQNNQIIGTGSGFMVNGGVFITNYHVATNGGGISVRIDGNYYDPKNWYLFANSTYDIYGVILSTSYDSNGRGTGILPTKTLPINTSLPEVGDKVYAIGSPNGLENTFSEGIVSAIRNMGGVTYIQHTADTESGSSGGVLLNEYGEAIGITTLGIPNTTQDFAVPMIYVQQELDKFK